MSTGYSLCFHVVLWIMLQILLFGYHDSDTVMASSKFTPYVSEFEYASRFHPSKNPDCGTSWSGNMDEYEDEINRQNSRRYERSPEEGPPVGQEPSIELRAILVRCPTSDEETDDILMSRDIYNITAGRSQDILDFHGSDSDEPSRHSEVRDCRRKIVITMRFNNIGRTKTQEEFVVIDHVLDPVTMHKARLLNPLVVKVRQEPVLQLYGLKFQEVVNAEAKEEVINNKQLNYKGCDDTSENPTCGQMFMEEKPIIHSQGFCCSCDPQVNIQRQMLTLNETVSPPASNCFSSTKDKLIKQCKNIRSIGEMFFDPSDPYESSVFTSSRDVDEKTPDSPKMPYNQQNFYPIEGDTTLVENSFKDERDLLNLKNFKTNVNPRRAVASRSDKIVNKNIIEGGGDSRRRVVSTLMENKLGTINENPGFIPDARRDSEISHKDEITESRRKHEEKLSKLKSSINIIDELAKLEADYKNFRISSVMRDEGRRVRTDENTRLNNEKATFGNETLDRRLNASEVENFRPIESLGKPMISKNEQDNGNIRVEENIHHAKSLNDVNVDAPSSIDFSKNPHRVTTTLPVIETQTAAVLWQKLASDRVYPSSKKSNFNNRPIMVNTNDLFHASTEMTSSSDEKIGQQIALDSNDAEPSSRYNLQSNDRSILVEKSDPPISQSTSITIGKNGFDVRLTSKLTTPMDHRDWNDFTTSFDETLSRAKNFTDSFSSFSVGNHTKNDALVSSGSLRNQLGNWLTYDEPKRYETEVDGEKSKKNYDEKIEFRNKGEIETMRFTAMTKKYDLHEDRSSASNANRKPVEIYFENRYDRESIGFDDKSNLPKIRSNNKHYSLRDSQDSGDLNSPRSYRSIADNYRFPSKVNDRDIDKTIDDNFEEISDVLNDAGVGSKIIRAKPKSEETFQKDNTVMEKLVSQVFDAIPTVIVEGNGSINNRNSIESQKSVRRNYDDYPGISRDEKEGVFNQKSMLRNINDDWQIRRYLHRNPSEQENKKYQNVEKIDDNVPVTEIAKYTEEPVKPVYETLPTTAYKVIIDRFTFVNDYKDMSENQKNSIGFTNVPPKVRHLIEPKAKLLKPPMIVKHESLGSDTQKSLAMKPRIYIDKFKIVNDVHDLPSIDKQQSNPSVSYDQELTENLLNNEEKVSTSSSKPDSSFVVRSPMLTIENLKKELQNEAEHYSSFSEYRSTPAASTSKKFERYWKNSDDVREINTLLTPAEKVEDFITDEETLPPDEETKHTTSPLPQTTNFTSSNATIPFIQSVISNGTVLSRLAIRNFQVPTPKMNMNKVSLLLEESFPSPSGSLQSPKRGSVQDESNHRRRHRRKNPDNKKHLTKKKRAIKRNSITMRAESSFEKRKVRNSDDPRHEINIARGFGSKGQTEMTMSPMPSSLSPILHGYKKRKRQYKEKPKVFGSNLKHEHEMSSSNQQTMKPEKRWSSIGRISNDNLHSRSIDDFSTTVESPGKRVENNPAEMNSNLDAKMLRLPLKSIQKKIIIQGPFSSGPVAFDNISETTKAEVTTERPRRNLQSSTSQKFPSFYPKSSDIIAASRNNDVNDVVANIDERTNKRGDITELDENKGAGLIFYNYVDSEDKSSDDNVSDHKRSLDDIVPEEIIGSIEPSDGWKEKMELLKLKKHADVLKEYLNWRQDVAPIKPQDISSCTTGITMTKAPPEETVFSVIMTASIKHHPTSSTAESTCSAIAETLLTPIEQASSMMKTTCQEDNTVDVTTKSSTVESSSGTTVTCDTTKNSDELIITKKVEVPTKDFLNSNDDTRTMEKLFSQEEASTGRILPPCNSKVKIPTNLDASSAPTTLQILSYHLADTSPSVISDNRSPCNDINDDLLIISILEKSQRESKKNHVRLGGKDPVAKIYKIRDEIKPSSDHPSHRRMLRKKSSRSKTKRKKKRVSGRRLMAVEAVNEDYDNYKETGFEESEENGYVDSSNDVSSGNLDVDKDRSMLKQKWNDIIDKIMSENSSVSSSIENTTKSWFKDFSDDNESVLKKLHFYDADKYIRKVSNKIVQSSNIYDVENEKNETLDSFEAPRRKVLPVHRKLLQYPNSMFRLRYRMADDHQGGDNLANFSLEPVHKDQVSHITEQSRRRNDGRDFAISLSGKIHVEGGQNGQPISVSFDTSPKLPRINESLTLTKNDTAEYINDTKVDASAPLNTNILPSIFNIAPALKESEHSLQGSDKNSTVPVYQTVRSTRDDEFGTSEENLREDSSNFTQRAVKIRKTRAVNLETAKHYSKFHDDESFGLEEFRNSNVDANAKDHPRSSVEDEHEDNADSPLISPDRNTLETGQHFSFFDEPRKLDNPEVRIIKIVPLTVKKASSGSSSSKPDENIRSEAKVSRMTASQLPKMIDDNVPGRIVTPGKIKPAELPGQEEFHDTQAHCSFSKDQLNELNDLPLDGGIPTDDLGFPNIKGPESNESENEDTNSGNLGLVPLAHMQIQQKPINEEGPDNKLILPLDPGDHREEACPNIGVTRPPTVVDDVSLCSQNNGGKQTEIKNIVTNPVVTTPCPEFDKPDIQTSTSVSDYTQCETVRPTEKPSTCENDREASAITSPPDPINKSEIRKRIRMKNMLAILEFMKKINQIMSGEDDTDFSSNDYHDAIIKLERVIIIPNKSDKSEITTHPTIGEDTGQNPSCEETSLLKNSGPSMAKAIINYSHRDRNDNEAETLDTDLMDNERLMENNEDQSFLFDGKKGMIVDQVLRSDEGKSNVFSAALKPSVTNLINKMEIDSSTDSSIPNTIHSSSTSFGDTSDTESMIVIDPRGENGPAISQTSERKTDDHVAVLRNEISANGEGTNFGKRRRKMRYESVNKRKAMSPGVSLSPMNQRDRSINHLPSKRESYDFYDQPYVGGQIDRSKSSSDVSSRISEGMFGKLATARGTSREKRRRKKKKKRKKKRRKKKRRKKKKKKKKGRVGDGMETVEKRWWPFKRQLMSFNEKRHSLLDSSFDLAHVEHTKRRKRTSHQSPFSSKQRKIQKAHFGNYHHEKKHKNKKRTKHKNEKENNIVKKNVMKSRKDTTSGRNKRQINPGGTQTRGGQDCMDRRHPPNVDPTKYLESAHCLRFSDLWQETLNYRYSVYELEDPIMEHTVYLQLYEKHSLADGTIHWDDLTQGTMVRMGTFTRHQRDDKPTIVFTYSGARMEPQNTALNLDTTRQRLLVPSPVPANKVSQYSAVRGPGEYLVVQANAISKDGTECDKAGVSFAAFAKQEDRCGRARSSCLKNQPLTYWRHDMEARDSGRPGCYFLSNFATVPTNPIKYNVSGTGSQEHLGLEYHSPHVSVIDIEVRTDYNAIVRVGSSGRVTEVYVDSTSPEHTVVTVVISNMGLASSPYQPRIADCPTGLPVSWSKAKGIMQIIPPQHDQRVTLDLYGQLLLNGFHCTVEVVNHRGELVAMRRIKVQKMDRCFCVWQCLCACIGSVSGLGCQPMSLEHYHAAGFQGPVPVITTETSLLIDTIKDVLILSALLILLLLTLGLLKWFVGLFASSVSRWGLDSLLDVSKIESYLESDLRCRCVVTNDDGIPVHPDTGQRTVRLCSRKLEFVLNLIFFLIYPIASCRRQVKKSLRQHRCCPDDSKTCLLNKSSCPKLICVSTYGDSKNSKLEAEDTRYVMNELKKSQESLQNPKGAKGGLRARKRDT